ncbi:MAG: O-antigen ligase family protein [Thermodesulfobacteriota bacterium]
MKKTTVYATFAAILLLPLSYLNPLFPGDYKFDHLWFFAYITVILLTWSANITDRSAFKFYDALILAPLLGLSLLTGISAFMTGEFKPFLFYIYALLAFLVILTPPPPVANQTNTTKFFFLVTLLGAALGTLLPDLTNEQGRYKFLFPSPTVFSVWLIACYALFIMENPHRLTKYAAFAATSLICLMTDTRLSIAFLPIVLIYTFINRPFRTSTYAFLYTMTTIMLGSLYYVYGILSKHAGVEQIHHSHEISTDNSYETRTYLFDITFNSFNQSDWTHKIFGIGAESARNEVIKTAGIDLLPHSDFMRILHDFGFLGLALHLTLIYLLSRHTRTSQVLGLLTLTAFMHNMIYSYFLILALIVSYTLTPPLSRQEHYILGQHNNNQHA